MLWEEVEWLGREAGGPAEKISRYGAKDRSLVGGGRGGGGSFPEPPDKRLGTIGSCRTFQTETKLLPLTIFSLFLPYPPPSSPVGWVTVT